MPKTIYTLGSLTFDIFLRPKRQEVITENKHQFFCLPFSEKIRVDHVHELFGGGAANTGISFKRLGFNVNTIGTIGDDSWANLIIKNLKSEKIKTNLIQKIKNTQTSFSVIINDFSGERTVLNYAGANIKNPLLPETTFKNCDGIHLCGSSKNFLKSTQKHLKKNPNKYLSWNPGRKLLEKGINHYKTFLPVVDIIFVNKEEAELFTGIQANTKDRTFKSAPNLKKIFQKIYQSKFQGIFVITDGGNGTQASDGKTIMHCPIHKNFKRIDTLGAGDAFASTFSSCTLKGKTIEESLKLATTNAGHVVSEYGAQPGLQTMRTLNKKSSQLKISQKPLI